jgi:Coenzyme PQQ synthesis protein D (PqqD)
MLDRKVRTHAEVVDTKLDDGEVVLLHLDSKTYYSLNLTAGRIWRGVKQRLSLKEISQLLERRSFMWTQKGLIAVCLSLCQ